MTPAFALTGAAGLRIALHADFECRWDSLLEHLRDVAASFARQTSLDAQGQLQAPASVCLALGRTARQVAVFLDEWVIFGERPKLCPGCAACALVSACIEAAEAQRLGDDEARSLLAKLRLCRAAVVLGRQLGGRP